jgi:hypothetical protein
MDKLRTFAGFDAPAIALRGLMKPQQPRQIFFSFAAIIRASSSMNGSL